MHTEAFINALATHTPIDREEEKHRDEMLRFVTAHPDSWWMRATLEGHVTGSAWVVNAAHTHALLLHHVKLNLWVQPGGHLDDTDLAPAAGAMREAREETGIEHLSYDNAFANDKLFDVDIHAIPARIGKSGAEPAHLHYDARYLIMAADGHVTISEESLAAKWIALEELAQPTRERSIARMAEKSLRLKS
ncbi:MAG: NUDIX hydrolase [Usitatibacteraceae bacterium]